MPKAAMSRSVPLGDHMKRLLVAALSMLAAGCQSAPEPAFTPVAGEELKALVVGNAVSFSNKSVATYLPDGMYNFKGAGQHSVGMYAIEGANICVVFIAPAGTRRCDQFALIDGEYFLVEEGGQRFKVASFVPVAAPPVPAPKPS